MSAKAAKAAPVAWISGAASGIGRAAALRFAGAGYRVLAVDRDASTLEAAFVGQPAIVTFAADVAEADQVAAAVQAAVARWGRLDAAFVNAGIIGSPAPALETDGDDMAAVFRVNVFGAWLCMRAAAEQMLQQSPPGGCILATASVAALRFGAGPIAYAASKAAVVSLVQTLANELAGTGIRVNALCPGLIETGMTAPVFKAARARGTAGKIGQLNALRRAGTADEVAAVALFLCGDGSAYINGQAIVVDGGLSSSLPVAGKAPSAALIAGASKL